jgi:cytochrome c oxidase assembly protein Cox11
MMAILIVHLRKATKVMELKPLNEIQRTSAVPHVPGDDVTRFFTKARCFCLKVNIEQLGELMLLCL